MTSKHDTHTATEFEQELVHHDDWFRHSARSRHHQEAHGQTSARTILIFLAATVLLVLFIGGTVYNMVKVQSAELRAVLQEAATPNQVYLKAMDQWNRDLSTYGWIDPAAGTVHIPLDDAINRVINDYRTNAN